MASGTHLLRSWRISTRASGGLRSNAAAATYTRAGRCRYRAAEPGRGAADARARKAKARSSDAGRGLVRADWSSAAGDGGADRGRQRLEVGIGTIGSGSSAPEYGCRGSPKQPVDGRRTDPRSSRRERGMRIDLNTVEEDEPAGGAVCGELWHACAGAGVALPRRGSAVVYLPQAHLAAGGDGGELPALAAAAPRVPQHVVCRVVDVELGADAATDEVYARLALVAEDKFAFCHSVAAISREYIFGNEMKRGVLRNDWLRVKSKSTVSHRFRRS
ncbi:unnamed protein product [Miscanthus lutarioriparius]|uniref:Uncharacterized protein n=1 Tax=Miscanthus lutarioriparius TaxID=422564 RepID=A0A811RWG8_9POAL|nr:unnamed protein product [Miscanthus lutarioriparius]